VTFLLGYIIGLISFPFLAFIFLVFWVNGESKKAKRETHKRVNEIIEKWKKREPIQ
jgi:hypothetical protein